MPHPLSGKLLAAGAALVATGFGTVYDDHWPPVRWQRLGTSLVTFAVTQREVDAKCGAAPQGMTTEGCTLAERVIVLPNPCTFPRPDEYARIACHEAAHRFAGWPNTHPR